MYHHHHHHHHHHRHHRRRHYQPLNQIQEQHSILVTVIKTKHTQT